MPKRKRSEENSVCANGDDDRRDILHGDGNVFEHAKRICQLPFISADTSAATEKEKETVHRVSNSCANEISTTTTATAQSTFAADHAKRQKCSESENSDRTTNAVATTTESPPKKRVRFDGVTVYYFHRSQGFTCVPTSGGNTLGMSGRHHSVCRFTLNEHEVEQNYEKRRYLSWSYWREQQRPAGVNNCDGIETTGASSFYPPSNNGAATGQSAYFNAGGSTPPNFIHDSTFNRSVAEIEGMERDEDEEEDDDEDEDEEDEDEDEEDEEEEDNADNAVPQVVGQYSATGSDDASQPAVRQFVSNQTGSEATGAMYSTEQPQPNGNKEDANSPVDAARMPVPMFDENILQPLGSRERRSMLRDAGVQVDSKEKGDCHTIRLSRQVCGCDCRGQCLPETCRCARDNIKCQVDRPSFPCGCTKQGCLNPRGRVEFNPLRVRSHYLNTMMRLRMENRRQQELPSPRHTRFTDEDTYAEFREGEETRRYNSGIDCAPGRGPQQSNAGFPAFHTLFSSSTSAQSQTTTICNDRSYWRLEATAPSVDQSLGPHEQSKNGYNVQHLGASWGCVYNREQVEASPHQQSYCASIEMDNTNRSAETDASTNGCYEGKAIYDSSSRPEADNPLRNQNTMYSLTALYSGQSSNHFNHNGENTNHQSQSHLSCGMHGSSFDEYSSTPYSNYVSSAFSSTSYGGSGDDTHCNGVIGERAKPNQATGQKTANRQEYDQRVQSDSSAPATSRVAVGDHSNSSDGSCDLPASPLPPELGAVLKKSICETALA